MRPDNWILYQFRVGNKIYTATDWLHGFPGLFTDTSEHICFYFLVFLFSTF